MKLDFDLKRLSAEFAVIFLGVAVALAADSYRETLQEAELEREYLERLRGEVEVGARNLESPVERYQEAQTASRNILEILDSTNNEDNEPTQLADAFVLASSIGGNTSQYLHNYVYEELVATGRLNIITDSELKFQIAGYYNWIDNVIQTYENLPQSTLNRFMALTGYAPFDLTLGKTLSDQDKRRIADELRTDPVAARELRLQIARIERYLVAIDTGLEWNSRLQELISSSIE